MLKKFVLTFSMICIFSFSMKGELCDFPICEEMPYSCCCYPGPLVTWASFTPFRLRDDRSDGGGRAWGQAATAGFSYSLGKRWSFQLYGIYEDSYSRSRERNDIDDIRQRSVTLATGWGGGYQISYLFPCAFTGYFNFSYVHVCQKRTVIDLTNTSPDDINKFSGHRWTALTGVNYLRPWRCVTLSADLSYIYVSNRLGGFVDPVAGELTRQNSQYGTLIGSGILFILPKYWLTPTVNASLAYDVNRHQGFPIFFPNSGSTPPARQTFPLRNRFEWSAGGGFMLKYCWASFSFVYLRKGRCGPINTDVLTFYGSIVF